jgi:hypothetical protein
VHPALESKPLNTPSQITSCVQRSKPVDSFPGAKGWIGNGVFSDENVANRLTLICIDLPSLRARANLLTTTPHNPADEPEAAQILSFAQMVDGNLAQWYATLPPEWKHSTIGIVSEVPAAEELAVTEKWPGEQHVYTDVPLASIVNDYRVCRIFCRRVIMACINWLRIGGIEDVAKEYEQSVFVIQSMVDDVSACVPFHLDYRLQIVAKEMGQEQNGTSTVLKQTFGKILTKCSCRSVWRVLARLAIVRRCECRNGAASSARLADWEIVCHWHEVWA